MSAIRDAIVKHLQADAAVVAAAPGGIFPGLPPEDPAQVFPFVTVDAQGETAERVFQEISHEAGRYLVKGIDRGTSPANVGALNALIRAALDYADITIAGYGAVGTPVYLSTISYTEEDAGIVYQHEGSVIELWARSA